MGLWVVCLGLFIKFAGYKIYQKPFSGDLMLWTPPRRQTACTHVTAHRLMTLGEFISFLRPKCAR